MSKLFREQAINNLKTSRTFNQIINLSETAPLNTQDEIKEGQLFSLIRMCESLDNNRIHFDNDKDAATFSALLITTYKSFIDGIIPIDDLKKH